MVLGLVFGIPAMVKWIAIAIIAILIFIVAIILIVKFTGTNEKYISERLFGKYIID